MSAELNAEIEARADLSKMVLRGYRWERFGKPQQVTIDVGGNISTATLIERGDFEIVHAIVSPKKLLKIDIKVTPTFSPAALEAGDDQRELSFLIREIEFLPEANEAKFIKRTPDEAIAVIYRSILRRSPNAEELAHLQARLAHGEDIVGLTRAMAESTEAQRYRTALYAPPGHFYSPIVDPDAVRDKFPRQRQMKLDQLADVDMDLEKMTKFWQTKLVRFARKTPFPDKPTSGFRYHFENPAYSYGDAITLRAMILNCRPKRMIEVGSGWSSACALDTIYADPTLHTDVTFIEPYPELLTKTITEEDRSRVKIIPTGIQQVPLKEFEQLDEGDILFIDSTHVLKTGSDVAYELCEVLPRLKKGVMIHFHDIFYPFEYGHEWVVEQNRSWNEIYALRNFLAFNSSFKVIFFNDFFSAFRREVLAQDCPKFLRNSGGSIWLRRIK